MAKNAKVLYKLGNINQAIRTEQHDMQKHSQVRVYVGSWIYVNVYVRIGIEFQTEM